MTQNTSDEHRHFHELLNDFDTAMLVTHAPEGHMHARPMAIAQLLVGEDIYLATGIDSGKVDDIAAEHDVTLTFQSSNRYASLCGRATIVRDAALIDRLWKEAWRIWFPGGKTDPNLALLKFDAVHGEYWDNAGTQGLRYAFEAARAYVKGETPRTSRKQSAKVEVGGR